MARARSGAAEGGGAARERPAAAEGGGAPSHPEKSKLPSGDRVMAARKPPPPPAKVRSQVPVAAAHARMPEPNRQTNKQTNKTKKR
eukprot:749061-Prorocentrum_minimum.AAC.1